MQGVLKVAGAIGLVGGVFSYSFVGKNKYTNRYQLIIVPEWAENFLGQIAKNGFVSIKRVNVDSPVFESIEKITSSLLTEININKTWNLTILDSDSVNAFVLPDGSIYVFTGLIHKFDNIDEIAFVLSHELSHVLLRHGSEKLSIQGVIEFLYFLIRIYITGSMDFSGLGNLLVTLPLSRRAELEADFEATEIMRKQGFNLLGALSLLEKLGESEEKNEIWSSHPVSEHRINEIKELLNTNPQSESTLRDYSEMQKAFISAKSVLKTRDLAGK